MPLDNTIQGSTIGGPTAISKGKKSKWVFNLQEETSQM